jgi:hypothetical protein
MVGAEDRVENLDKEAYRSLGKMLHAPFRIPLGPRSLADLKDPDCFLNLVRVG